MSTSVMEPPPPTPEQLAAWAEAEAAAERELAAADAAAAVAAAAAAAAPPPAVPVVAARRGVPAPLLFALPVFLAVAAGVASAVFVPRKAKPKEDAHAETHAAAPVPPSAGDIEAINVLIRAGAYGEALSHCKADPDLPPDARRTLAYREAVCQEALGRLKDASAAYKKAEHAEGNQAAWARAVLGQARCAAAADDVDKAQGLLDRVVLRSGHPDCAGTHVFEECLFMRARLDALRAGPVRATDPFDAEAVAWPSLAGAIDKYFEWLAPDTAPASNSSPSGPNAIEVRRAPGVSGGFEVTAHCAERPIGDAVAALAAAAGLRLQTDPAFAPGLAKDVVALDVDGIALGDVVGALVRRADAGWKIDGGALVVGPGPTVPGDRAALVRAFARALVAAPKHPRAVATQLWLPNLEFVAGRTREAAKEYQHVLDTQPEVSEVPLAVYNLGLAELRTGALLSARSRFVDLVDRAPRTKWAEYGWWWAGRTHLDAGDPAAAKRAFESAQSGRTQEVRSAAAIGICACDLSEGKDESAKALLAETRGAAREEHMLLRTALEALIRYRAAPTESRRKMLLDALREASDGRGLGPGGTYLVGRVYGDLKMSEKMVALFDAATDSIRGPLAVRMTFEAAEWYDLIDRRDAARPRYLAVAAADPKGLGPKAELKLAALALRAGNPDECIRRCRAVADAPGVERSDALALMGRGYEARRNYRQAAECFGGRVPVE